MAMVSSGFMLEVTLIDNGANTTTRSFELVATTATDATTGAGAILTALGNVSDGVVSSYSIRETFVNDALSLPASQAVQAEVSASMTCFVADAGGKKANYRIPMPKSAIFNGTIGKNANTVDTANVAVLAFHALYASGTGVAHVSDGESAGGLIDGIRVSRKSRQG